MSANNCAANNRRSVSRIQADLNCQFSFEGLAHDARIANLSLNGALLASSFIPPEKSAVVLTIRTPLKNFLILESEVVRTEDLLNDGADGFAVRFSHISLDLIELIKNLVSQPFRVDSKESHRTKRTGDADRSEATFSI